MPPTLTNRSSSSALAARNVFTTNTSNSNYNSYNNKNDWSWTPEELSVIRQHNLAGKKVVIHSIAETDTLAGVAIAYGIKVSDLRRFNNLFPTDNIHLRSRLIIPLEFCALADIHQKVAKGDIEIVTMPADGILLNNNNNNSNISNSNNSNNNNNNGNGLSNGATSTLSIPNLLGEDASSTNTNSTKIQDFSSTGEYLRHIDQELKKEFGQPNPQHDASTGFTEGGAPRKESGVETKNPPGAIPNDRNGQGTVFNDELSSSSTTSSSSSSSSINNIDAASKDLQWKQFMSTKSKHRRTLGGPTNLTNDPFSGNNTNSNLPSFAFVWRFSEWISDWLRAVRGSRRYERLRQGRTNGVNSYSESEGESYVASSVQPSPIESSNPTTYSYSQPSWWGNLIPEGLRWSGGVIDWVMGLCNGGDRRNEQDSSSSFYEMQNGRGREREHVVSL